MGRFYKTANPQFLDYMYELPKSAMLKASQIASQGITENRESNQALNDLLELNALEQDKEARDSILNSYQEGIDNISKEIQKNPLEYRRKSMDIGNLRRKIEKDFREGDAAKIQSQYNTRQQMKKSLVEAYEKDPDKYNYEDISKLMSRHDSMYSGYKDGGYRTGRLAEYVDINKLADENAQNYEAEIIENLGAYKGEDGYLYTSKYSNEKVDPKMIESHLIELMMQDENLNKYYGQQMQLGNIDGEGYANLVGSTARRMSEKYGYEKTEQGRTSIKTDSRALALDERLWDQPLSNTTTGKVTASTVMDKYNVNTGGSYSLDSLDTTIDTIEEQQSRSIDKVVGLAGANNIYIDQQSLYALTQGDFSILGELEGANGETISPQVIREYQKQYDNMELDRRQAEKLQRKASEQDNPDQYLQGLEKGEKTKDFNVKFSTVNNLSKEQVVYLNKANKLWQDEFENGKSWYNAPILTDKDDMKALPKYIKDKLKDGVRLDELIGPDNLIKPNTETVTVTEERINPIMSTKDNPVYSPQEVKKQVPGKGYQNFKVNGDHAKPAMMLSDDGKAMAQVTIEVDGHPVDIYVSEDYLGNTHVGQNLDRDNMESARRYRQAEINGAIDDNPFEIDGVEFYKDEGGKTMAKVLNVSTGKKVTIPADQALQIMSRNRNNRYK